MRLKLVHFTLTLNVTTSQRSINVVKSNSALCGIYHYPPHVTTDPQILHRTFRLDLRNQTLNARFHHGINL